MASPQLENGYTKIADELLTALCHIHLSGNEWSFLHALIRKTYGYNKKEDWITNTQIAELTGMRKERVSEAKRSLISKNIVTENRNKIAIQKDYDKWLGVTENRNKSYGKPYLELRKSVHTKDNTTKDNISDKSQSMKKNKLGRYSEDGHNDYETAIDIDSGEEIADSFDEQEKVNKKVTELIEWAEGVRGKPFMDRPTQRKFIHDLRTKNIHPDDIKSTYLELLGSDYWREQKSLPDFKSVFSNIKNRK
jgi:phage replication O-like protein O